MTLSAPALTLALLLTACGGGGGGGGSAAGPVPAPVPPLTPDGCAIHIVADTAVAAGKVASASVLSCGAPLGGVTWTQLSGPTVQLLASRQPTVAFETSQTGTIGLRADVTLADGSTATATVSVSVGAADTNSYITVRADHSVRAETDTSLRAWPVLRGGDTVRSIAWTQTAGPAVTMDTRDPNMLFFTTPKVAADTVLKFRATMTTSGGRVDYDDVAVGIDRQAAPPDGAQFAQTARVHPYRQGSRYAAALTRCAYDVSLYYTGGGRNNFCASSSLPLLAAEAGPGGVPSVAQIMGRVLVSHDFLGANFEQFLLTQDPNGDLRRLLASVSAVVIGSHVRPSFYNPATGAIHLDADNLWLTPEQRDVVTEVPDYRAAFSNELQFSVAGRQVRNNNANARQYIEPTVRGTRVADELVPELGTLLYHELAHAGDALPPADRDIAPTASIWDHVAGRLTRLALVSDTLAARYPLTSVELRALGQVAFIGAKATDEQRAYTAADVGRFFDSDVASNDYAYAIDGSSNSREDAAMLFEEFMMVYRHGIRYDLAFTSLYTDNMASADDLVVAWGQRGRIAQASIKPRIKLVLQGLAPWIDVAAVDSLPAPLMMVPGTTWGQNLALGASASGSRSASRIDTPGARAARGRAEIRQRVPRHVH